MVLQQSHLWLLMSIAGGVGVFCAYVWRLFGKAQARLVKLEVRPPQTGALLRPPGHSLTEDLFKLIEQQDQKTSTAVMCAILGSVLLCPAIFFIIHVAGAPALLRDSRSLWITMAASFALVGAIACGYRAFTGAKDLLALKREMHARRLGLRGEQAVAEVLHSIEVAGARYVSFHDVPKEYGGNIDHVVVGPGGVFVIETKTRSERKPLPDQKRNRIKFNGRKAEFPSGGYDFDAAKQCQRNADVVAEWLNRMLEPVSVTPLLVYPGWEVHMTQREREVTALSANQLRYYFRDKPRCLTDEQREAASAFLDAKCRDVKM